VCQLPKIQQTGAADALMLDAHGYISETNATNVFMVKARMAKSPLPLSQLTTACQVIMCAACHGGQSHEFEGREKILNFKLIATCGEDFLGSSIIHFSQQRDVSGLLGSYLGKSLIASTMYAC